MKKVKIGFYSFISVMLKNLKDSYMYSNNCIIYNIKLLFVQFQFSLKSIFFGRKQVFQKNLKTEYPRHSSNTFDSLYCFDGSATIAAMHDRISSRFLLNISSIRLTRTKQEAPGVSAKGANLLGCPCGSVVRQ